ncbi:MAG: manganese-dependent inorganic pyrophosphatase [Patescibacteria group bacterium]|nr:manganese-dependent inorganic pyrophosphatase [Patescibacteria group bacterium]MCL5262052.1 manganese-dependent inorganic pyrophosphatase [Patescibacteria group bacterium]
MNEIYVIGHKSPDTDSVCSAIVYAGIKGYIPARLGEINKETAYALDFFKTPAPQILENAEEKKIVCVDHNEATQMADGWDKAEIVEIIDHHKINFDYASPIYFHSEPVGCTATIIAKQHRGEVKANPSWAGLLLSAILSDTVVFKSPTTTEEDKAIAAELAAVAGIEDVIAFGVALKTKNADIDGRSIQEIIVSDFKDFDFHGKKIGIGQIEVVESAGIESKADEIIAGLQSLKQNGYEAVFFMVTDIMKAGTRLFFAGDEGIVEKAFGVKPENNSVYLPGVMSRKKQIVPELEKAFA